MNGGITICTETTPVLMGNEGAETQNRVSHKMQNFSLIIRFCQFLPESPQGDAIMTFKTLLAY